MYSTNTAISWTIYAVKLTQDYSISSFFERTGNGLLNDKTNIVKIQLGTYNQSFNLKKTTCSNDQVFCCCIYFEDQFISKIYFIMVIYPVEVAICYLYKMPSKIWL